MKKKKIIILSFFAIVIFTIICVIVGNKNIVEGTFINKNESTGKEEITEIKIIYKNDLPYEMILEVECEDKEVIDTSYEVMNEIVKTIKLLDSEDPTTLERDDNSFELRTTVESDAFTYVPKDISIREMKEYLSNEGWEVK